MTVFFIFKPCTQSPGPLHPLYPPTIPPHQPGLGTTQLGAALCLERTETLHPGQLSPLSLPHLLPPVETTSEALVTGSPSL